MADHALEMPLDAFAGKDVHPTFNALHAVRRCTDHNQVLAAAHGNRAAKRGVDSVCRIFMSHKIAVCAYPIFSVPRRRAGVKTRAAPRQGVRPVVEAAKCVAAAVGETRPLLRTICRRAIEPRTISHVATPGGSVIGVIAEFIN